MNKVLLHLICLLTLSCNKDVSKYNPIDDGYTKLSVIQIIERGKQHNYPKKEIYVCLDEFGNKILEDDLIRIKKDKKHVFDNYIDDSGEVRLMIVRPMSKTDSIDIAKVEFDLENHYKTREVELCKVDCSTIEETLKEVLFNDQYNRKHLDNYQFEIDLQNISKVVSIIENCEQNVKFTKTQIKTIWLIISHSSLFYQEKYYSLFKNYAKQGLLQKQDLYLIKDKILVAKKLPQIYGTQVSRNKFTNQYDLCEVDSIESLNLRRESAGFEPIEDYLLNWNIIYDP